MADPKPEKEKLKKSIEELKGKLAKAKGGKKTPGDARVLRKSLKRAQRRLTILSPLSIKDQDERVDKLQEMINKRIEQQGGSSKKIEGNPYLHSLRKKTKALNKLKKRLGRATKRAAAKAAPPAKAPEPAPAAAAAEPEKKD